MTEDIPGLSTPAAGFDLPLAMLEACHRRVERQCTTLRRLAPHLAANGADAQARDAAGAVMRYFDTAARDHHADEEEDLFPALLESMAGSDAVCLREMTRSLCADHRELERRWAGLRSQLDAVAAGRASALSPGDVQAFVGVYERHIACEETELLPMARRLLGEADIDRIGRAMLERRGLAADEGVAPPTPPSSRVELPRGKSNRSPVTAALTAHPEDPAMSPPHLHLSPDAIYPFDARGVAKRFRHAAIFGALDSLNPGETMRFANDHDPLPLLGQIAQRYGDRVTVEYRRREPGEIVIDFSVR